MKNQACTQEQSSNLMELIAVETKRLADKYNKSFLDCEDIIQITGLGRNNVRTLMSSNAFPVIKIGNRKIVSIIHFIAWQFKNEKEGE